jgi:hypothetical protein
MTPERRAAMTSCVSGKFEAQVHLQPKSLTDAKLVDNEFSDDISSCNQTLH